MLLSRELWENAYKDSLKELEEQLPLTPENKSSYEDYEQLDMPYIREELAIALEKETIQKKTCKLPHAISKPPISFTIYLENKP